MLIYIHRKKVNYYYIAGLSYNALNFKSNIVEYETVAPQQK